MAYEYHKNLTGADLHDPKAHAASHASGDGDSVDHNTLTNYDANKHVDHTGVSIATTTPLAGGGDISSTRTLTVGSLAAIGTSNYVVGVNNAGNAWEYKQLLGTINQVTVTHGIGSITLSTPQDIHTGASPQFVGLTLTGALDIDVSSTTALLVEDGGTKDNVLVVDTVNGRVGINKAPAPGTVLDVTGNAMINGTFDVGATTFTGDINMGNNVINNLNGMTIDGSITSEQGSCTLTFGADDLEFSGAAGIAFKGGTDSTYDLGDSTHYWSDTYTDVLYLNATAYFSGAGAGIAALTGALTTTGNITLDSDSGKFFAGADQDLEIYHDGSDSYFVENIDDMFFQPTGTMFVDKGSPTTSPPASADPLSVRYNIGATNAQCRSLYVTAERANTASSSRYTMGLNAFVYHKGSHSLTNASPGGLVAGRYGAWASGSGGTITMAKAVSGYVSGVPTAASIITDGVVYYAEGMTATDADLTITNGYNFYGVAHKNRTVNAYHIYLEDQVNGTTSNYAIYSAGGQSVHAGNFRIGSTAVPTEALHFADAKNIAFDTTTGTKIGTATNQLIGFYNATPVNQPDTVADPAGQANDLDSEARTAIDTIIDRLQELGLVA